MILYHWRGPVRNFGDELNTLLWPGLLPGFFDDDPRTRFLGIGSILDRRHPASGLKLVAGSGYGGYEARTALDETWIVHWVRGPRTARLLGLPARAGIGDPGSLIAAAGLAPPPAAAQQPIAFMPHFESAIRGTWAEAAALAGLTLIDPRGDPTAIIAAIGQSRVLISEALHGVIVADALRVPWIPIRPLAPIHRPKWFDWADSLEVRPRFQRLVPSSALERAHLTGLARFHAGRILLTRHAPRLTAIARARHIERAAEALHHAARAEPALSTPTALDRGQSRMMHAIEALRHGAQPLWRRDSPLREAVESAYDPEAGRLTA